MPEHLTDLDKDGMLDATPLRFGKHRGKTPAQVAEKDPQYLVWAYEEVSNFDVCSAALYRDCGGKWKRAEKKEQPARTPAPTRAPQPGNGFDDYDDEIPF